MRPIERDVYKKIDSNGCNFSFVEEIVDGMSKSQLKKSYPDDCLFQSPKYFAKSILDTLIRSKLIEKKESKYFKVKKENKNLK